MGKKNRLPAGSRIQKLPTRIFEPQPERATAPPQYATEAGASDPMQELGSRAHNALMAKRGKAPPQYATQPGQVDPAQELGSARFRDVNQSEVAPKGQGLKLVRGPDGSLMLERDANRERQRAFIDDVFDFLR